MLQIRSQSTPLSFIRCYNNCSPGTFPTGFWWKETLLFFHPPSSLQVLHQQVLLAKEEPGFGPLNMNTVREKLAPHSVISTWRAAVAWTCLKYVKLFWHTVTVAVKNYLRLEASGHEAAFWAESLFFCNAVKIGILNPKRCCSYCFNSPWPFWSIVCWRGTLMCWKFHFIWYQSCSSS